MPESQAKAVVETFAKYQTEMPTKSDIDRAVSDLKYFILKTVIGTGAGLLVAMKIIEHFGF